VSGLGVETDELVEGSWVAGTDDIEVGDSVSVVGLEELKGIVDGAAVDSETGNVSVVDVPDVKPVVGVSVASWVVVIPSETVVAVFDKLSVIGSVSACEKATR
jgi:hypothetical protein